MESKSIILYFSRPGYNYVSGSIVNLKVGNTQIVAEKLQKMTGADIFRIEPQEPYVLDYTESTEVAAAEKKANARPAYKQPSPDLTPYDTIYIGAPSWWGTLPMIFHTFIENNNHLAGKTLCLFMTHEGSGLSNGPKDLQKLCPDATLLKGLAIKGSNAAQSDSELAAWLKSLHIAVKAQQ